MPALSQAALGGVLAVLGSISDKNALASPHRVHYLPVVPNTCRRTVWEISELSNLSGADLVQEQRRKQKEGKIAVTSERRRERRRRLGLFVKHYWHRLVGAAVGWFAWDFYYCKPQTSLILALHCSASSQCVPCRRL